MRFFAAMLFIALSAPRAVAADKASIVLDKNDEVSFRVCVVDSYGRRRYIRPAKLTIGHEIARLAAHGENLYLLVGVRRNKGNAAAQKRGIKGSAQALVAGYNHKAYRAGFLVRGAEVVHP